MENRIKYLLDQFESGAISGAEKEELLDFTQRAEGGVANEILSRIEAQETELAALPNKDWIPVLKRIFDVDKALIAKRKSIYPVLKWAIAAAILIALGTTFYTVKIAHRNHDFVTNIKPGANKATLTLANGKTISLTDASTGNLAKESGITISKTANGELIYRVENLKDNDAALRNKTNTITTPKGGEWQIQLPDGTRVWLNAASSLVYPLVFNTGARREVTLTGEGYFEVAKDPSHPFIVHTALQDVQVLGTHFNINSYTDEGVTRTTLLEGSVRVSIPTAANSAVLRPNEQSTLSNGTLEINNTVDVQEAVSWKDGYFMFNNERQESIMRKIARWYNLEVEYTDEAAKNVRYYGTISRFDKISQVLKKFEHTGEVRFDIRGNTLLVSKD